MMILPLLSITNTAEATIFVFVFLGFDQKMILQNLSLSLSLSPNKPYTIFDTEKDFWQEYSV